MSTNVPIGTIAGAGWDVHFTSGTGTLTPGENVVGADSAASLVSEWVDMGGVLGVLDDPGTGIYDVAGHEAISGNPSFAATVDSQTRVLRVVWDGVTNPFGEDVYCDGVYLGTCEGFEDPVDGFASLSLIGGTFPTLPGDLGKAVYFVEAEVLDEGRVTSYARQLKELLPRGAVWLLEAGSVIDRVLTAIAVELSRVEARARDLIEETDPRTATETLGDWERVLALPDDQVLVIPATTSGRRVAVTQKFISRGGQNAAYFIALAAACGYVVTVATFFDLILRAGFRVNARVYDDVFAFTMLVTAAAPTGTALSHADFERVIRHVTHAHIQVMFVYL